MKNPLLVFPVLLATALTLSAAPRLVVSTPGLAPESTIDLVLDSPAAVNADLGKEAPADWLQRDPPLPGRLIWKSPTQVSFELGEPPQLGTTYTFSIAPGLHHLDGTAVPAGKVATLKSEPFRPGNWWTPSRWTDDYDPVDAPWLVSFNDAIDPAAAVNYISFVSDDGQRVAAQLATPTLGECGYYGNSNRTWEERFPGREPGKRTDDSLLPAMLRIRPVTPLQPAKQWKISILEGLPNAAGTARLEQDTFPMIGEVLPFAAYDIEAVTQVDAPRRIAISFNAPLPEFLPVDFLTKCLEITPRPANLSAVFEGRRILLTGDLLATDQYQVRFRPPFTSRGGLDLAAPFEKAIKFRPHGPHLALPSNAEGQLASGSRTYKIRTINLQKLHVRVKQLDGTAAVRALQGYNHYTGQGHAGESIAASAPLPYPLLDGTTLLDKEIPLDAALDTSREITLNWDEILPAGLRGATLFLDVSGEPREEVKRIGGRQAQAIVQLTDIGLAWKISRDQVMVHAFSCTTGQPLPGAELELFGEDATFLAAAATGAEGTAEIPRPAAARHLRVRHGGDTYLTAFDERMNNVGLWHFPVRYSWRNSAVTVRKAFLFTDRALYRPGETFRLKGIVREQSGNAISLTAPAAARLVVVNPTGNEIHSEPVVLSEKGSFDAAWRLPAGKTGLHTIRLEFTAEIQEAEALEDRDWTRRQQLLANARFEVPLRVEDFRRNAFELTQSFAEPANGTSSLSADLAATYYQGQPVAAGKVRYFSRVTASNPYPERFRDYLFGDHRVDDWAYWYHYFGYRWDDGSSYRQINQQQGEALLGDDGKARLAVEIPQAAFPTGREVTVSTEVTDANNQTLTTTSTTTVHPAEIYVGVSRRDSLLRAGSETVLKLVAANTAGDPCPAPVTVTATLTREVHSAVKSRTGSGAVTTRDDVREETISSTEIVIDPAASAADGVPFRFTPTTAGKHYLTLNGTDAAGHAFSTAVYFNVYGTADYPWLYEDGMRVKLVAEKKSYQPGETARVLVLSPIEGTAWVTVEREKILRSFQVQLKADNPVIEIPLVDEDAPNAFVSVLIVKGAAESAREIKEPQLRLGYCELTVANLRDTLAIALNPGAPDYRPGEDAMVSGSVLLADGSPAAGAEVTFYAEDEGTLAVTGYETPQPMAFFHDPRNLDVRAGTSFESFIPESPDEQSFYNKGFFIGGGGDMEKLTGLMRRNFDPCAAWAATLTTDAAGRFSHHFTLPDSLTRYRLIAVAHHGGSRFGHAESSVLVKKDLMLEPKAPRFAHQGDAFNPQVLVQNASSHSGTWEIRYRTGGGTGTPPVVPEGAAVQTVDLAAGASATVVFPSRAVDTGEAVLDWTAVPVSLGGAPPTDALRHSLSDAVEVRFQSVYPMPLLRQVKQVSLRTGERSNLRDLLDAALLEGAGEVELEFARSPLLEAGGSVEHLLHYPYGCVEQTTSSLMPWLAVDSLRQVVPALNAQSPQRVAGAIQAGVDRLLSMQLPDGSFAYWPGDRQPAPWATPYAGLGLVLSAGKGASVPPAALERLKAKLIADLRGISAMRDAGELEIAARSLMVLSIAGAPQVAYQNLMVDRIGDLTPSARCMLASAIALRDGSDEARSAARAVLTSAAPFPGKRGSWMRWPADDAMELMAWVATAPGGGEADATLDRMMHNRNPYGHWRTTWVNGWSLMAMARYAEAVGLEDLPSEITLTTADGSEVISLNKETPTAARRFELSQARKLEVAATGSAYIRVKLAAKPRIAPVRPVATNGLSIDRTYERVNGDGTTTVLTEPAVGDLIRVSLRVTLPEHDARYLVIDDPLPALFETVNSDFQSQTAAAGIRTSEQQWHVSHSELRTDRAVFFLDRVWRAGTCTLTYLARCTVAGTATAPPAKVESMYDPENFALSASRVFTTD